LPPTFIVLIALALYVPVAAFILIIGSGLMPFQRTRLYGRRLVWATLATGPALAASGVVAAGVFFVVALAGGLLVWPWTSHNQITSPVVGGLFAFSMLFLILAATLFVCAATVSAWQIGWRTPSLGLRQAFTGHRVVAQLACAARSVRSRVPPPEAGGITMR
jgi:hypothetical protein